MRRKRLTPKPAEMECGSCHRVRPIQCSEMKDGTPVDFCGECWEFICELRGGTAAVEQSSLMQSILNPCTVYRLVS